MTTHLLHTLFVRVFRSRDISYVTFLASQRIARTPSLSTLRSFGIARGITFTASRTALLVFTAHCIAGTAPFTASLLQHQARRLPATVFARHRSHDIRLHDVHLRGSTHGSRLRDIDHDICLRGIAHDTRLRGIDHDIFLRDIDYGFHLYGDRSNTSHFPRHSTARH